MGRGPAGADGPQRLVGDHAAPGLFAGQAGQRGLHLPADEGVGLSGLVLRQVLAHADDGGEVVGQRRVDLAVDGGVALDVHGGVRVGKGDGGEKVSYERGPGSGGTF